ncbi:MAG: Xylose isomerase-like barrel, partial [Verrucomicrobiaceae bacterium]|nr:Xylose isomerase-like barrel [Verrucomicrobiaceae bacterium]
MTTRRHFISTALAGATSLSTGAMPAFAAAAPRKNKLCAFTKHLQGLSYDQIADIGAECGLDGLESPVRPGGHVEPMKIEEDLPKFMEALKKRNLELTIMT